MTLILALINCCKTKAPGGEQVYQPSKTLQEGLTPASYKRLMAARRDLAELLGEAQGPDLGFDETTEGLNYLPASRRYIGRMYQRAQVEDLYPGSSVRLTIVSALYGLLDAGDSIREYALMMCCKVSGKTVARYWNERGLGEVLHEYIKHFQPVEVHDLLTDCYRKALKPWPECITNSISTKIYRYPGQGSGAMFRRGEDLESLLRGFRIK